MTKSGDHVMYKTKGDNNDAPDLEPVLSENVVAEYKGFTVPYIGYFMNFMNSKNGALMFIIPGVSTPCILRIYDLESHLQHRTFIKKGRFHRKERIINCF